MKRRFSIKVTVIGLFILITCITATVAISLQYYFSREQALHTALEKYQSVSYSMGMEVREQDQIITNVTKLLADLGRGFERFDDNNIARNTFANLMNDNPMFYSTYIARGDGHFYQLINLESVDGLRANFSASAEDRWVLVEIKQNHAKNTSFYDKDFKLRQTIAEQSKFNALERPWFVKAKERSVYKTAPYLFHNVQLNGQTFSSRIHNSSFDSVIGVDVVIASLAKEVKENLGIVKTELPVQFYIYDESGSLYASSEEDRYSALPPITPMDLTSQEQALITATGPIEISSQTDWPPLDFSVFGKPSGYFVDLARIVSLKTGAEFKFINGFSWLELVDAYKNGAIDILSPVANNATTRSYGTLSTALAQFDFSIAQSSDKAIKGGTVDLSQLQGKRLGILKGWSIIEEIRANYPDIQIVEIDKLHSALKALHNNELDGVMDLSIILQSTIEQRFIKGLTLNTVESNDKFAGASSFHMVTKNLDPELASIINRAISEISQSEIQFIRDKWFSGDSPQGIVPYEFLIDATSDKTLRDKLSQFEADGVSYFGFVQQIDLYEHGTEYLGITVPTDELLDAALSNVAASTLGSAALLALLIPLSRLFSNPIIKPIHELIEQTVTVRKRQYLEVSHVQTRIKELDELSKSIKVTAAELASYEKQQQEFVDSFIQLIAQAIDDKSPYTAGHCNRVPDLAIMLAKEAENASNGSFATFKFANDIERREFKIAAWLHDCGKITTPEHIVDKGSKLEANYNRIHEIRTRFEVMIRDQVIAAYKNNAPYYRPDEDAVLQQNIDELRQEFALVAQANIGSEAIDESTVERIQDIANKTWIRYLDNRLGLSPEEERHLMASQATSSTPALETLLADRPEHLLAHPNKIEFDPRFEIKMTVPEYLANQGEVYNLCIGRGTLTAEDRYKINEHIISTIKMLESMPFPDELSKVPRYASTHHETMKGTGYPRQLKGEDLSIPERIIALADVFEALTAADRPYKKAKTLSESLKIMRFMVLDEHLDKEVYLLFLQTGSYLHYAKQHLEPEQIDEIDIKDYWV
ncbi:hypothetical protein A9264_10280 [Vibrio sp. UCD-FRSSP16_10]|uniref:HD domain-containing phosphohydrolase n=1 Tax=unclassified Vibrio TaxID=2614977 RepID=UPI000801F766|nr:MULTISPECIES: HD domain-containing phosphohydrolase [unclassified Vibrio]OBT16873.1 hypothetical protein A9260_10505 [Vibrio sp. UCD-FRSSP16_30]OBT21861.1 hypothetical protein A9264_10280 [Vibrio sp. UCD-FRSSP16_10]